MQDESPPSLSVSIVCYNSSDAELRALVVSIIASVARLRLTHAFAVLPVYLIDNSETQQLSLELFADLAEQLESQDIALRLVQGQGNVGYGRGHNLALEELTSKYHLILNPDVQLDEDCLSQGVAFLEDNAGVVLASPFARFENGEKQFLCKRYPSVLTFLVRGFLPGGLRHLFGERLARYEMHELDETAPSVSVPIASGCFMLCRSAALRSIGGFDPAYFLYFEDFDLSLRMGRLGKLAYLPAMRIQHAGGHAARKGQAHLWMFLKSGIRFFNTHGWRFFRQAG